MINTLWENLFRKSSLEKDFLAVLSDNYIFSTLSKSELKFVQELLHTRKYRAGEAVFKQGEVGIGMYLIQSGAIDILVEDLSADRPELQTVFVTRLATGDFFGELSLVEENGRRSALAMANTDTTLIGFFKPDLLEIVERNPATGAKILLRLGEVLGRRLKDTTGKVSDLRRELKLNQEKTTR